MPGISPFAQAIATDKYFWTERGEESWADVAQRVVPTVLGAAPFGVGDEIIKGLTRHMALREWMPGGRYCYATGRPYHQVQNCLLLRAEDSREGLASMIGKASSALMSGAGIGIHYGQLREKDALVRRTGGLAAGSLSFAKIINECGREMMQGGSRRSAIWAGLPWNHPDALEWIRSKDWSDEVKALKAADFSFPATLDHTNMSICLDDAFFVAYRDELNPQHELAHTVFWAAVARMLKTGEPGFSVDVGANTGENLRNACTEITSFNSDDICNLGSINLGRVQTIKMFRRLVNLGTTFLLAGTLYSDVPYPEVDEIRSKNRRLGLGLMGVHDWLLTRGKRYGPDDELEEWLAVYQDESRRTADNLADDWGISRPVKVRAIAPTGTIGIVAETTTGIEPILCAAYKRRYLKDASRWVHRYVVDPTAWRLIESGVRPDAIEDAYALASSVERRVRFQRWVQRYVDHGISSTINLPHWGHEQNNKHTVRRFGNMLLKHLPYLRGITCYPDGARGGQPLSPVDYETAIKIGGEEITEESADVCSLVRGGSCGD